MEKRDVTRTKGNILVEDIKLGDTHYEYEYNCCIKSTVISLPVEEVDEDGEISWSWQNKTDSGRVIDYSVSKKYAHYGPNVYDYEAYQGCTIIE